MIPHTLQVFGRYLDHYATAPGSAQAKAPTARQQLLRALETDIHHSRDSLLSLTWLRPGATGSIDDIVDALNALPSDELDLTQATLSGEEMRRLFEALPRSRVRLLRLGHVQAPLLLPQQPMPGFKLDLTQLRWIKYCCAKDGQEVRQRKRREQLLNAVQQAAQLGMHVFVSTDVHDPACRPLLAPYSPGCVLAVDNVRHLNDASTLAWQLWWAEMGKASRQCAGIADGLVEVPGTSRRVSLESRVAEVIDLFIEHPCYQIEHLDLSHTTLDLTQMCFLACLVRDPRCRIQRVSLGGLQLGKAEGLGDWHALLQALAGSALVQVDLQRLSLHFGTAHYELPNAQSGSRGFGPQDLDWLESLPAPQHKTRFLLNGGTLDSPTRQRLSSLASSGWRFEGLGSVDLV